MNFIRIQPFLSALLLFALAFSPKAHAAEAALDASGAASSQAPLLLEVKALSQARALNPPDPNLESIQDVRAYLKALDPYSTYISPEERRFLADMDKPDYSGIGMEVIAGTGGDIFCIPFESGPAFAAGIRSGDRLVAVDGKIVAGGSLEILPALVRGSAGSPVTLRLAEPDGSERELTVIRAKVHRSAVETDLHGDTLKIRIYRFEAETPGLVRQALSSALNDKIVIDLRGNIGGELKAAVETAGLFLPPDALIAKVLGRPGAGLKPVYHRNTGGEKFLDRRIIIWQDQMTASASEVFVAALIDNGQAINIGRQTFGKALVQEVFPASNGGLFIITTGEIVPPGGRSFNKVGIAPYSLIRHSDHSNDDIEVLRQTEKLWSPFQVD